MFILSLLACLVLGLIVGSSFVLFRLKFSFSSQQLKLHRGLQLLDGKIAIIEDLAKRTEKECMQLTELLEKKTIHIQRKIQEAKLHTKKIENVIQKSYEVVKIFREKLPHQEIADKENQLKYIKAAKRSYKGHDVKEIAEDLKIPLEEVKLIQKMNKKTLSFNDKDFSPWVRQELKKDDKVSHFLE